MDLSQVVNVEEKPAENEPAGVVTNKEFGGKENSGKIRKPEKGDVGMSFLGLGSIFSST
jgi:hypothetical protein